MNNNHIRHQKRKCSAAISKSIEQQCTTMIFHLPALSSHLPPPESMSWAPGIAQLIFKWQVDFTPNKGGTFWLIDVKMKLTNSMSISFNCMENLMTKSNFKSSISKSKHIQFNSFMIVVFGRSF